MRIFGLPKGFYQVLRRPAYFPSEKAKERLKFYEAWKRLRGMGLSGKEAARALGVSRATLYRWERRVKERGPRGLEDRSRRPLRVRQRQWSVELVLAVKRLREAYPAWGKAKLWVLLRREGWEVSESTVGRVLSYLARRGEIEPVPARRRRFRRRGRFKRSWAVRLSGGCEVT